MNRNNHVMLLLAIFWLAMTVISREMVARAVDMSLAVSCLAMYIQNHFPSTSTQKMWLNRFNVVALAAAAIFLILRVYYMFIA